MEFDYDSYEKLLITLWEHDYKFCRFGDETSAPKKIIIRHDIDFSPKKALEIAEIERRNNVRATYFFLTNSDFYNVYSLKNRQIVGNLLESGHEIGLHFDEKAFEAVGGLQTISKHICREARSLAEGCGCEVRAVSMHRPSKVMIENDLDIPGIINSYSRKYYCEYKYVSDSRRLWHEDIIEIIKSGEYDRLQILAHPFWYSYKEQTLAQTLSAYLSDAYKDRYKDLDANFTDLSKALEEKE